MPAKLYMLVAVLVSLDAAAGVNVRASLDDERVSLGRSTILTITVEGSQDVGRPDLGDTDGLEVTSAGRSTSVQIVNGSMSVVVTERYVVTPTKAGTFVIGPITVPVRGTKYPAGKVTLNVVGTGQGNDSRTPGPGPAKQFGGAGIDSANRTFFVTASVSNPNPYQGEQIVYTFRFYRAGRLADANLEMPGFDGFVAEDLGKQRDYQVSVRGRSYLVTEIKKALFPQEVGMTTIGPAKLTIKVPVRLKRRRRSPFDDFFDDDFFNSPFDDFFGPTRLETKVLKTEPVHVDVKALPPAPEGFSGLVGEFRVSGRLSKDNIELGESTTLTVKVEGVGDIKAVPPPFKGNPEVIKVYPDKPSTRISRSGGLIKGAKVFKQALVPLKSGDLQVPAARLVYFDPKAGVYRTASAGPFKLSVSPSQGKEELKLTELVSPAGGKVAVKVLGTDILPIHEGLEGLSVQSPSRVVILAYLASLIFPPFVFGMVLAGLRRKERLAGDQALRRRKNALKNARKALAAAAGMQPRQAIEQASKALKDYVGDMLNISGGALTPRELKQELVGHGVSEELAEGARRLLESLEQALYGGKDVDLEPKQAVSAVRKLVKKLHRSL